MPTPSETLEIPEYNVLEDSFFEPNLVPKGSVVRTFAPPGPHLHPLNDAARAAMAAWYEVEIDEIDPKTHRKTGEKVKPHAQYKFRDYAPGELHSTELVSGPPIQNPLAEGQTLAEIMTRRATDQRPKPSTPPTPVRAALEAQAVGEPPPVEIVTPAPPSSIKKVVP